RRRRGGVDASQHDLLANGLGSHERDRLIERRVPRHPPGVDRFVIKADGCAILREGDIPSFSISPGWADPDILNCAPSQRPRNMNLTGLGLAGAIRLIDAAVNLPAANKLAKEAQLLLQARSWASRAEEAQEERGIVCRYHGGNSCRVCGYT